MLASSLFASCRYLASDPTPRPDAVIEVPTSNTTPGAADTLEASLAMNDKCLLVVTKDDKLFVPIWPTGFVAKLTPGTGALGVFSGPDGDTNVATSGKVLELHGELVATPPADAVMPSTCAGYPLFHVKDVRNSG